MLSQVKQLFPKRLSSYLLPAYQVLRRRLEKLDRAIDKRAMSLPEFIKVLEELGITAGATVMIHSSMDAIARRVPEITPIKLIRILQELLGPEGTLLVPTFPFQGLQVKYVDTQKTFNVRKTASQVGLMTEVFRRMPGVIRSFHPTHPIAGWGKHARELLSSHHLGTTFGDGSPIYELQRYNGLVIGIGTGLTRFTIMHVPEEIHPRAQLFAFEPEPRVMTIVNGESELQYSFQVLKAGIERNYQRVTKIFLSEGILKNINPCGLQCAVVSAEGCIKRSLKLIDEGNYLFKVAEKRTPA